MRIPKVILPFDRYFDSGTSKEGVVIRIHNLLDSLEKDQIIEVREDGGVFQIQTGGLATKVFIIANDKYLEMSHTPNTASSYTLIKTIMDYLKREW